MARVVIMGVAGCGKSSVGAEVAARLGALYLDGDDLHPAQNLAKMRAGVPLADADRWPWLARVGAALAASEPSMLIGCSALKRRYRDAVRAVAGQGVVFVHLTGTRSVIAARMSRREGHFMPLDLLESQFADLDPLASDETGFAVEIDRPFETVVAEAAGRLAGRASFLGTGS